MVRLKEKAGLDLTELLLAEKLFAAAPLPPHTPLEVEDELETSSVAVAVGGELARKQEDDGKFQGSGHRL